MAERGRVKNRRGATVRRADQILTLAFGEFPSELLRKKNQTPPGNRRRCFSTRRRLPRSFFQQSLFQLFLALDAMARPGHGIQAFGVDLLAAMNAFAETAFADANQGLVDHLQQMPFIVALAEQKFFRVGTGGTVGDILRGIFIGGTAVFLRTCHRASQLLLPCFQSLFECFQFLFIHKSFKARSEFSRFKSFDTRLPEALQA